MSKQSKNAGRKMISLSAGQWEPKEVGEVFGGIVTDKRLVNTQRGLRVVVTITDESTGESIEQFASNIAMQNLARVPDGGYVELRFDGMEKVKIGRQTKELPVIKSFFEAGMKLGENPFAAELAEDKARRERGAVRKSKTKKG